LSGLDEYTLAHHTPSLDTVGTLWWSNDHDIGSRRTVDTPVSAKVLHYEISDQGVLKVSKVRNDVGRINSLYEVDFFTPW